MEKKLRLVKVREDLHRVMKIKSIQEDRTLEDIVNQSIEQYLINEENKNQSL